MAQDHTARQPSEATWRGAISAGGAFDAERFSPPPWAHYVDVLNPEGIIRISTAGTDGDTLDAHYLTIPSGAGYASFPLKGPEETALSRYFYVAAETGGDAVEICYRPRQ